MAPPPHSESAALLLARVHSGDRRALARAISLVEDKLEGAGNLLSLARALPLPTLRIGVTGPPGAGKSTLVDRLVRALRDQGRSVAVLAVDPSSPYTGGALLGDRIRMSGYAADDGVYLRSMASRGAGGGLAASTADVCDVMAAAAFDFILIETVGAGQAEVEIASLADVTLLVLVPGMGDDIQSLKAGTMEIADILVINKADLEGADRMEAELIALQSLDREDSDWVAPVVRTVATTGEGVAALCGEMERFVLQQQTPRKAVHKDAPIQPIQLDHLGIAVRSIDSARAFYASLGLAVGHEETVEHEQVRTAMISLGDTRLELIEATAEDSTIGRFVARRGEGLHHMAVRMKGIDALFERLRNQGVRIASDCVRIGAGGHRYFFIHPAATGGVLLEIVGEGSEACRE